MNLRAHLVSGGIGLALGALGCFLLHRPPSPPPEQPPAIPGTAPVTITTSPPATLEPRKPSPARAKPLVLSGGTVEPIEPAPPVVIVQECPPPGVPPPAPVANWELRPGDLGLRDWRFELFERGEAIGARFYGTLTAQTPAGEVAREFDLPEFPTWVAPKALGPSWWLAFEGTINSLPGAEIAAAWGKAKGRGYRLFAARDFDREEWYYGAGLVWKVK